MKFMLVSALVAGASLVAANAAPELTGFDAKSFRFGHAMGGQGVEPRHAEPEPAKLIMITSTLHNTGNTGAGAFVPQQKKKGCHGGRFRSKAISIANTFRVALGFAPIEPEARVKHHHHPHPPAKDGTVIEIMPMPFIGAGTPIHAHHNMGGKPFRSHFHHADFSTRLHHALRSLGPWEGAAVAFVFGCGIGVLLRMFFVLTVIAFRAIRGRRSEAVEETHYIILGQEAEELFVAPPEYNDEKVDLASKV